MVLDIVTTKTRPLIQAGNLLKNLDPELLPLSHLTESLAVVPKILST